MRIEWPRESPSTVYDAPDDGKVVAAERLAHTYPSVAPFRAGRELATGTPAHLFVQSVGTLSNSSLVNTSSPNPAPVIITSLVISQALGN